jgi:hypothetical protein
VIIFSEFLSLIRPKCQWYWLYKVAIWKITGMQPETIAWFKQMIESSKHKANVCKQFTEYMNTHIKDCLSCGVVTWRTQAKYCSPISTQHVCYVIILRGMSNLNNKLRLNSEQLICNPNYAHLQPVAFRWSVALCHLQIKRIKSRNYGIVSLSPSHGEFSCVQDSMSAWIPNKRPSSCG